jgi:hypothetical protein
MKPAHFGAVLFDTLFRPEGGRVVPSALGDKEMRCIVLGFVRSPSKE